ncbi:MAG: acyl-CoA dehydrogenase family protein [Sphingomonadaceae bacterium]|nr:acyl-CoA dehydrogenase family protein [Sphingomonadaceae bacterium]
MDMGFSDAYKAFQRDVQAFLAEQLTPYLREAMARTPTVFVEQDIALGWQALLNERGWAGYLWPESAGGPGWTPVQRYIFERECAIAGAPGLVGLGLKLAGPVIYTYGTAAQKEYFLPRILSGEHYWCQGYSEAGAGSDLASLKTRAELRGDHYVVNGSKMWTTHAHFANWMFCLARTQEMDRPQQGISFLLIDMDQPGVEVRPVLTLAGDHEVNAVFLDDARVPVENRVGAEGQGWEIAKFLLENERGGSCFAPILIAQLRRLRELAQSRPDGCGGTLLDQPSFVQKLCALEVQALALEAFELRLLAQLAQGIRPGGKTSIVKLVAADIRQKLDLLKVDAHPHHGLALETHRPLYRQDAGDPVGSIEAELAMPMYLNSRARSIFGGSTEIQRGIIAKQLLNL